MKKGTKNLLTKMVVILLIISNLIVCFPQDSFAANATSQTYRLAGFDRYQTAQAIAENYGSEKVHDVVLSTGIDFADALSASVLAHAASAPILLVDTKVAGSQSAFSYITQHLEKDGNVYIIGGTGIIPATFEGKLNSLGFNNVFRVAGYDRYETSYQIANTLGTSPSTVVIASGESFPDALSISSFAANKGWPILLTSKNTLPSSVKNFLTAKVPSKIYIVGGTGVISSNVEAQVQSFAPQATIERLAGQDRFDTNAIIVQKFAPSPKNLYIATGNVFADALVGSSLASKNGDPILLIESTSSTPPTAVGDYINLVNTNTNPDIVALGGTAVVSNSILSNISDMLGETTSVVPPVDPYKGKSAFVPTTNQSTFNGSDSLKDLVGKYGTKWYEDPTRSVIKGEALLLQLRIIQAALRRQGLPELSSGNQNLDNFSDKSSLVASVQEESKILKSLGALPNDNGSKLGFKEYTTRAEEAQLLTSVNESFLKMTSVRTDVVFNDVLQNSAKEYISYAYMIGLMDGVDKLFYPNGSISIEQLIQIMDKEIGAQGITADDVAVAMNETFKVTFELKAIQIVPEHSSYSVKTTEETQIKIGVTPATTKDIVGISSDPTICEVVSVDQSSNVVTVKGIKVGVTFVTISLKDDSGCSVIVPVTVTDEAVVKKIIPEHSSYSVKTTEETQIKVGITPATTEEDIVGVSNDLTICEVVSVDQSSNVVTIKGVKAGLTFITISLENDGSCNVVVPVTVTEEAVVTKIKSTIKFSDIMPGATEIFAVVTLESATDDVTIECNAVKSEVKKISATVYYVLMSVDEGTHGTLAVSVSGSNLESNEAEILY